MSDDNTIQSADFEAINQRLQIIFGWMPRPNGQGWTNTKTGSGTGPEPTWGRWYEDLIGYFPIEHSYHPGNGKAPGCHVVSFLDPQTMATISTAQCAVYSYAISAAWLKAYDAGYRTPETEQ